MLTIVWNLLLQGFFSQYVYHQKTDVCQQIFQVGSTTSCGTLHVSTFRLKPGKYDTRKRKALGIWIITNHLKCNEAEFERKGKDFGQDNGVSVCHTETVLSPVCLKKNVYRKEAIWELQHRWKGIFKMYLGELVVRMWTGLNLLLVMTKIDVINDESCVSQQWIFWTGK